MAGDLMDPDTRRRAVEGMDAIIHLAFCQETRDVWGDYTVNALGTYLMLEAARDLGVPRFVYASTLSVYCGRQWKELAPLGQMSEDVPPEPGDIYGLTKYLGEEACSMFARNGLPCTILRLTGVTLPPDWERAVANRSGSSTHVDDVALGFRLAMESDPPAGMAPVYHICGDHDNKVTPIRRARAELGFSPRHSITVRELVPA